MRPLLRRWCLLMTWAAAAAALPGCASVSDNPSYFPYLLPFERIVRTHAKPPGRGYFANFDPHAVRLEVVPLEAAGPVRSPQVLIATVLDEKGDARRHRRVEWLLEGVGNLIEVDESGLFAARGYKVDNRYAVTYTDYREHRISRGNGNPADDILIKPGQSWCVIDSAVEGDTYVTAYAPEVANWDNHKVVATCHWVDAAWAFPRPGVARAGTERVCTTQVWRHTDRQPLANYRVRYRLVDGPPALFLPGRGQEEVAVTQLDGHASVALAQVTPQAGVNRVAVEIIRAPDPSLPSGVGMVVARGETTVEWQAPALGLGITGPPAVAVGQEVSCTITVTNTGKVENRFLTVRDPVPDTLQYVSSDPPATVEGDQLIWTLGELAAGQSRAIRVVFRSTRTGTVVNTASVASEDGAKGRASATTQVTAPQLKVSMTGPPAAAVGAAVTYEVTVTNPGTGTATNVVLTDEFDKALEHESKVNPLELRLAALEPGQSRTETLTLRALRPGRLVNRVTATADGGLTDRAEHEVAVQDAKLGVKLTGPRWRYADRPADWNVEVANDGDVAVDGVELRDQLPPELAFQGASAGGQFSGGEVVWALGTLRPGERKVVQVKTTCAKVTPRALNQAVVRAGLGVSAHDEAAIEVRGLPAYRLEVMDLKDPVEVGANTVYRIEVFNQGSLEGNQVQIMATVPKELRVVNATGPTAWRQEGQNVVFAPADGLQPKQKFTYTVEVQALEPAAAVFRVELRSATLSQPVVEEEPTRVYSRRSAGQAAPEPPTASPPAEPRLVPQPAPRP